MSIKNILVSQPKPQVEHSPYFEIEKTYNTTIDFHPFIQIEGLCDKEIRLQKIDFSNYTAIIFTSRSAIDHFFRLAEEMRYTVPDDMKYFCQSEAIALYLQVYIVYRKRKIYVGEKTIADLIPLFEKNKNEKYLVPAADIENKAVAKILNDSKIDWTRVSVFHTVSADLKDIDIKKYQLLTFFSPLDIKSLFKNFPDYKQGDAKIYTFGPATTAAAEKQGLKVDVSPPSQKCPSMTMAVEHLLEKENT